MIRASAELSTPTLQRARIAHDFGVQCGAPTTELATVLTIHAVSGSAANTIVHSAQMQVLPTSK